MASKDDRGVNVQVVVRCRPPTPDEQRPGGLIVKCDEARKEVLVNRKPISKSFTFDKVFGTGSKQSDVYDHAVSPIVDEVLEGFNCTIFAYGQTGTGKTFTMEGDLSDEQSKDELPSSAGVIPRSVQHIFKKLAGTEHSVKVSFLELYNEDLMDLLAVDDLPLRGTDMKKMPEKLQLMEDGKGGVIVKGQEEKVVKSSTDILALLEHGMKRRKVAETLMNKQSSRSHSIFTITIHITESSKEGEGLVKCGKLNLVDLAGSESIGRSGAKEARAREAGEINKSLLTLGRVITALVEHGAHIPYRESKLTRLLRESLGGKTKTLMIATVSPAAASVEETLQTLEYGQRTKSIKNKPEANQRTTGKALVSQLVSELERYQKELQAQREKNGVYVPYEQYDAQQAELQAMKEKIAELETGTQAKAEVVDKLNKQIKSLQDENSGLKSSLSRCQSELAHERACLQEARASIAAKDVLIGKHREAEASLSSLCSHQRSNLEAAKADIAGLFGKIERLQQQQQRQADASLSLQQQHRAAADELMACVARGSEDVQVWEREVEGRMTAMAAHQAEHLDLARQQTAQLLSTLQAALADVAAVTEQRTADLQQSLSEGERGHADGTRALGESLSDLQSSATAAVSGVEDMMGQLAASLDDMRGWMVEQGTAHRSAVSSFHVSMQAAEQKLRGASQEWSQLVAEQHSRAGRQMEEAVRECEERMASFSSAAAAQLAAHSEAMRRLTEDTHRWINDKMGAMVSVAHVDSAAHVATCDIVKASLDANHADVARMTSDLAGAATSAANSLASSAAKRHKAASDIVEGSSSHLRALASSTSAAVQTTLQQLQKQHATVTEATKKQGATAASLSTWASDHVTAVSAAGTEIDGVTATRVDAAKSVLQSSVTSACGILQQSSTSAANLAVSHEGMVTSAHGRVASFVTSDMQAVPPSQLTPCKRHIEVVSEDFIRSLCVHGGGDASASAPLIPAAHPSVASLTIESDSADAGAPESMPPTPTPTPATAVEEMQHDQQQQQAQQLHTSRHGCKDGSMDGVTSMAMDTLEASLASEAVAGAAAAPVQAEPAVHSGALSAACDKAGAMAAAAKKLRSPAKSARRPSQARLGDISNMPR